MSIRKFIFTTSLIVLALALNLSAIDDSSSEVMDLFSRGESYLSSGEYQKAADIFSELETRFKDSENYGLFIFNGSKAKLYLKSFDQAASGFRRFIGLIYLPKKNR